MGYYTKLHIDVSLKYDTPKEVIETIEYIFYQRDEKPNYDFRVLNTDNVRMIATGKSAYFMGVTNSEFTKPRDEKDYYQLTINSNIKNYEKEYEKFLELIAPYVVYDGFIGYIICEDWEQPVRIYSTEHGFVILSKNYLDSW